MSNSTPQDALLAFIRDAINRIDIKIDGLDDKMSQDHKDLMTVVEERFDKIEAKVNENSMKIQKHEHNFNVLTFLFTGGIATAVSWMTWLGNFFAGKH